MKKIVYSLFLILTSVATLVSCQKDEADFSLSAVIADKPEVVSNPNAKVYIDPTIVNEATVYYARWHNGDNVNINGRQCSLTVTSSSAAAYINNITPSAEGYTAVYPYSEGAVAGAGATTATVTIPASQSYHTAQANGSSGAYYQVVDGPMVAYCASGDNIMKFHNAAGIIRVHVTNSTADAKQSDLKVHYISVETSDGSYLAGSGTVATNTETPSLSVTSNGSKSVTLDCCDDATDKHPVITAGSSMDFYLAVAPFSGKQLKIKVMTEVTEENTKKRFIFSSTTSESGSVTRNQIGHFAMSLTNSNYQEVQFLGAGTKDCPFLINDEDDLKNLRTETNKGTEQYCGNTVYYKQTDDIELKSWSTTLMGISSHPFSSNYDGDGHSITKLTVALFGCAGAANSPNTIKNLTVSGNNTTSSYAADRGGLVNNNPASTFLIISCCTTNVTVKSTVTSSGYNNGCGGIVGTALGSLYVESCENQGNVYCSSNSSSVPNNCSNYGGIVGLVKYAGTIDHCSNVGTIGSDPAISGGNLSCQAFCSGGIIGRIAINSFKVNDCHNYGIIRHTGNRGFGSSGGIVGRVASSNGSGTESAISSASIRECTNGSDGQVIAVGDGSGNGAGDNTAIGGICGGIYGGSGHIFKECVNNGIVSYSNTKQNKAYVGGIIGILGSTTAISIDILDCTNNHAIQGSSNAASYTGGILGYSNSVDAGGPINIVNCSNKEAVRRGNSVGGIAGYTSRGKRTLQIYNCYSTGDIETSVETSYAGGIVGRSGGQSTNGLATNCYSSSIITLYDETGFKGAIAGQVSYGTDIVDCYGIISASYGKRINSGTAGYTQFSSYGTIDAVTTALCTRLNDWVSTNNGEGSTYKTWQQSITAGNPTEYPHF